MTFVTKYLVAPALGAAGVFAGYVVYRRRFAPEQSQRPDPAGPDAKTDLDRLAEAVERLTARVTVVEHEREPQQWLAALDGRLAAMDRRITSQNERIAAIESGYGNIEARLDAILRSLDSRAPVSAV